jgi:iron complex transport system ATP-binding protein
MLQIRNLSARLGDAQVLHAINLSAAPGQLLAICGPNGAGKSTLLRAALGEIGVTGEVSLNGLDIGRSRPATLARIRAVLPQDTQVAFAFRVGEIVAMGQEAGDFGHVSGLVGQALAAVGLAAHAERDFQTLSGGEKQRTHLARALAQVWQPLGPDGPRWLLLDEPVASLDLGQQLQVMQLARAFADAGGGVVAVMHDLNLSAMFADRMALLTKGGLIALGRPEAVLTAPLLRQAYDCDVALNTAPRQGPWFVPQSCTWPGAAVLPGTSAA